MKQQRLTALCLACLQSGKPDREKLAGHNSIYQSAFSPNLLERPRLESHLQKLLTDAVKMRGLIAPASKETRIPKSIYEGIQTINRNLVCMLELQINAYWATRPSHFVLLNAQNFVIPST